MEYLKDKKLVGIIVILLSIIIFSIVTYGKNKNKVFKDEYMKNIFVEEESSIENLKENYSSTNNELAKTSTAIVVEIKGEVNKPDVYQLKEGSIVKDLIDMAGGLTSNADISKINRAKMLQNHELIFILNKNDINLPQSNAINGNMTNNELININTANIEELKKITGIGDVKAQSIIDYREKNGGFKDINEMKNIDGIGDKTFEKIKDKITL